MSLILPESDTKVRDANGRFVRKGIPPEDTVSTIIKSDGPDLTMAPSTAKSSKGKDSRLDEPLLSLVIQNPFKKLLHWLDEIRKKQTTTFNFKISIPLIALPIFLAVLGGAFSVFFNLGKSSAQKEVTLSPTPVITQVQNIVTISKVGYVKATYSITPTISAEPTATASPTQIQIPVHYILSFGSSTIFLSGSNGINFQTYLNKRVLITGLYDQNKNILTVNDPKEIELLP